MKILSAEFETTAVKPNQYPKEYFPEIAFVGRSNVGKSSLINSLLNRKKLVKTSATPGKTQTINFFRINDSLFFADLPGYGFAKVPEAVKKTWGKMIEEYLLKRETLRAIVFIVDIRRKPGELDFNLKHWLDANGIDYILAITKADKISQTKRTKLIRPIEQQLGNEERAIPYSSKTSLGRKELWARIIEKTEGKKEIPQPPEEAIEGLS
ncbi:MAG: YihA family ribosome biogenesis GTP-binding protein [Candidatus Nitrohelix vancouverensis]|uniref:Probable GTP-binding protein EngB n=1 Tax=Candidatus Nitrohelix vancouverensis TaxID=2705534 RepID=A0A7T0C062_9BACT|nr:MAG: YihA family ribosome biogenesis GTP-binding protein [Candidatus Nitrohelix vancouverensis]